MNTTSPDTLLEFPCDFPIKAMGRDDGEFETLVIGIVRRHAPDLHETAIQSRPSKAGNYLSVTVTVRAHSREQLDNIYLELTACEQVLMAL
ncbi:MAG: YbeD family protein [Thiohalomonadaceae bacterium]